MDTEGIKALASHFSKLPENLENFTLFLGLI